MRYRVESEIPPVVPLRLKVEINTREHFDVFGAISRRVAVRSPWFEGRADIGTYTVEELLATKLRALYQRRKGRDLFDLWVGVRRRTVDPGRVIEAFVRYMEAGGHAVSRAKFERNLAAKIRTPQFDDDLRPLLTPGTRYNAIGAGRAISKKLLARL